MASPRVPVPMVAALTVILFSQAVANDAEELVVERRDWVAEIQSEDYFYWERFLYRFDNPGEFPMPKEWYRPSELVLGEPGNPFPVRPSSERHLSQSTIDAVDQCVLPRRTGALYIAHEGQIEHQVFGEGLHAGSLVAIRSITKSLNALLVGIAIDDGYLDSVDEPIGGYLTEWVKDGRGKITIRQLLHMSSGIEAIPMVIEPDNKTVILAEGSDVYSAALAYELAGQPDVRWTPNQVDTQLIGMVLERATGKRFAQYLSEKIWRPMGLGTATVNVDGKYGNARTFCCMRARAIDVVKIGQMMIDSGRWNGRQIVPSAWIREMLKPSPANSAFGLHVYRGWQPEEDKPAIALGHSEPYRVDDLFYFMGGLSIMLWMSPSQNLVVFRWGDDPPDWDASRVPNIVLDDLMARNMQSR